MTATKQKLSGSSNGRGIKVAATATPGTTIHAAVDVADTLDEVWLWAENTDSSARTLTLEWGGTTDPDDLIEVILPANSGLVPIVPGFVLDGGVTITAFGSAANVIVIFGFVNRLLNT